MDSPALMIGLEAISGQWSGNHPFHTAAVPGGALARPCEVPPANYPQLAQVVQLPPTAAPIDELQVLFAATKSRYYGRVPVGIRPTVSLS